MSADGNYKALNGMQKTKVETKVLNSTKGKSESSWTIHISNNTGRIAFFMRPQLMVEGDEVLPGYWTSGYFTLAPSETITLTVSCPNAKIANKKPEILVSGWNVDQQRIVVN